MNKYFDVACRAPTEQASSKANIETGVLNHVGNLTHKQKHRVLIATYSRFRGKICIAGSRYVSFSVAFSPSGECDLVTMRYLVDDRGVTTHVASSECIGNHSIVNLLGIDSRPMRDRLLIAIRDAVQRREPDIMLWRAPDHLLGLMLEIRPAREIGRAVVTANDLDEPIDTLNAPLLVDLLGITRAEAEVAIALFEGDALSEIARARQVKLETVRGQVKNLLHKLNLPNQKRLTLLLSRIALSPLFEDPPHGGWPAQAAQL